MFLFLSDPEENMSSGKKETVLSSLLKNDHLRVTLELKPTIAKFCLLYANIAPKWNTMIACERTLPQNLFVFFKKVLHTFTEVHLPLMQFVKTCNLYRTSIHGLDALLKIFTNNLDVLNPQTLGSADHVYWFQTQLMESCLVVGSG